MYKRIKKIVACLMTLSMLICSSMYFSAPAQAKTLGGKWDGPVKIYVSDNYPYYTEFKEAANEWNKVFSNNGSSMRIKVGTFRDAHVYLDWAAAGASALGDTEVGPNAHSGTYTYGTMTFKKGSVENLSSSLRKSLYVHELGHLLGLDHSPKNAGDSIMSSDEWDFMKFYAPQKYDIKEILSIY